MEVKPMGSTHELLSKLQILSGVEAVSYTHLDVYKRQPVNHAMTLAAYTEHWLKDIAPGRLAASTYSRDQQDIRRILPALGHYKLTDLRKDCLLYTSRCV